MGLDVYAKLYAGVEMKKVYKNDNELEEVTRYREDTGESYQKKLSVPYHILGNKKFTQDGWDKFCEDHDYKPGELEFVTISEGPPDVLGILVARTESHRNQGSDIVEISPEAITDAFIKAKAELAPYGITDIKLLLVPIISY